MLLSPTVIVKSCISRYETLMDFTIVLLLVEHDTVLI
jgi:hypothetical protein